MEEWKKGFVPFELTESIWVVPPWCPTPEKVKKVILMEPGMAFGTGTHETTQIAAQLLSRALSDISQQKGEEKKGKCLLDVGTGTGILALLSRHLGVENVIATDIDLEAVRVAKENIELNKENHISVSNQPLDQMPDHSFDVVVANIIDGVLLLLQSDLKRLVKPGGKLIMSGIIQERWDYFEKHFDPSSFKFRTRLSKNEWHGVMWEAE